MSALALALALLIAPVSPRRRLEASDRSRRPGAGYPGRLIAGVCRTGAGVRRSGHRRGGLGDRRRPPWRSAADDGAACSDARLSPPPCRGRSTSSSESCASAPIRSPRSTSRPTRSTARSRASLRAVAARARLGADVAAGLRSVGARYRRLPAHWERLAVCWHLAQTHGLAIATLMQTAQRDIVERERFSARVGRRDGRRPRDRRDAGRPAGARRRPRPADRSRPRALPALRRCRRMAAGRRRHPRLRWPARGQTASPRGC